MAPSNLIFRDLDHYISQTGSPGPVNQQRRAYRPALSLGALPHDATIATSSTRRAAQARERRPDLKIVEIRGNVGTRLRKIFEQSELDATLLAAAGLQRLQIQLTADGRLSGPDVPEGLSATPISVGEMLPCVGQAAIGIEIRAHDPKLEAICAALNHAPTMTCITAERAFLSAMGGGCNAAIGAYAELTGDQLRLRGVSYLHQQPRRAEATLPAKDAVALGQTLATLLTGDWKQPPT